MQQYDRVAHTDSAPSVIALENFPFKVNKNKSESFFQPLFSKPNFLNKPLECFHTRSNKKKTDAIEAMTIENDNEDLARFIEDNYQYFKKQNGGIDLSAAATVAGRTCGTSTQLQACSDSDFLTLKNNIECCDSCNGTMVDGKRVKSKKHKMAALSDSDFIVSFGNKSKKFTLKSKIPFAKTILTGKFPKANKYNTLNQPANKRKESVEVKRLVHKGLNNNLSKSLNGCHRKNNEPSPPKCIHRVLSEGNGTVSGDEPRQPPYDAFDMFIKLFQCDKNNKNICDKQSNSKFNYKIVVNSKDYDYCDSVLVNYASNSCEKIKSLSEFQKNKSDTDVEPLSTTDNGQVVLLNNPCEDSLLFNINGDINLHSSHVLVNNLVITSPPVTPNQLLSPKTINKEATNQYFSHTTHLSPHVFSDTSNRSMDMIAASPLDQLANIRNESDVMFDLKVPSTCNLDNTTDSNTNFIKNDLTLTSMLQRRDKNGSTSALNINGSGRIRKPSVTYDINVINKSQDFNIDDICPQRSSYAARSGSTTSTST